jgi:hypothetical protein
MKKLNVFLMSIVFLAFMGLSVSANSDEPKSGDSELPTVTDPSVPPVEGEVINPCGENIEVCIFTTGEGVSEGSVGSGEEVKVCTVDEQGNESCVVEIVPIDGQPIDKTIDDQPVDETPVDCEKDPTVCQRLNDGKDVIYTMAPTDGVYEDGIYYMTGTKDLDDQQNKDMVTVSVVASSLGLILLGVAVNRKIKKN